MRLSFHALDSDPGLEIVDPIERRRVALYTNGPVRPSRNDGTAFRFPVDAAVSIRARTVSFRQLVDTYVRDSTGDVVAEVQSASEFELPANTYRIELNAPVKLSLRVTGPCTITARTDRLRFDFGSETRVLVGARSYHQHPAATVTTTDDPVDMMAALSALGSALKTTSCERSYPTLRGHPPLIELGDELDVPDRLRPPETGVSLELPPEHRALSVAAPLAYYLGATVVPGDEPRLLTEDGFEHALETDRGFEREVERVLKQTLFLDCLTRTEGYYPVRLREREAVEPLVDLDFERLYDRSLSRQLAAYLAVPFEALAEHVPQWFLTAYIDPSPEHVEVLPFVVNDLAVVRSPNASDVSASELQSTVLADYLRGPDSSASDSPGSTLSRTGGSTDESPQLVQPEPADSLEQAWFAEGIALGASKATPRAFRNKLDRAPKSGPIDITVVCNDGEMSEEHDAVDDVYGSRDELPFDVTLRRNLSTDTLRTVLESETDFLHYIGHIDANGLQCRDGMLDVETVETVGVDAFLLNACQSYRQGMALIEAGSVGGVVTFSDVVNSGAVRVGRTMARLLNLGFPLRAALTLASDESVVGGHYVVVGDGSVDVAQVEDGVPTFCELEAVGDDGYDLTIRTYLPREAGMGTMVYPYIETNDHHFLAPGELGTFHLTESELEEYLRWHRYPFVVDGKMRWTERDGAPTGYGP